MSIEAMDRNGCNSVYAKGKTYLSAIIIIPTTNVEVCCRMSLVDEEGKQRKTTRYSGFGGKNGRNSGENEVCFQDRKMAFNRYQGNG